MEKLRFKKIRRAVFNKRIKAIGFGENCIRQIYILNLDRKPKRWYEFSKKAESLKANNGRKLLEFCTRISAVDAKDSVSTDKVKDSYSLNDQYYVDPDPRLLTILKQQDVVIKMTKEEIAIALSHIKAWETIIREKRAFGLILEDDVNFELNFAEKLNQIWNELSMIKNPYDFDMLYLSFLEVDHGFEKTKFTKSIDIPKRGLWWMSGYVLSYQGALKLMNELPICGPVDLWINLKFSKLKVYVSNQSLINQRDDILSDNNYSIVSTLNKIGINPDT